MANNHGQPPVTTGHTFLSADSYSTAARARRKPLIGMGRSSSSPYTPPPRPKTRLDVPTMHVPQLPIELIDAIADAHVKMDRFDKSTLRAMACVCHAWLPVARSHLHKKVTIRYQKLASAVEFFQGPSGEAVTMYMREMTIHGPVFEDDRISVALIPPLLTCLPRLQSLALSGFPFEPRKDGELMSFQQFTLDHVRVAYESHLDDRIVDLVAFLNIFSEIGKLEVIDPIWDEEFFSMERPLVQAHNLLERYGKGAEVDVRVRSVLLSTSQAPGAGIAVMEVLKRSSSFVRSLKDISVSSDSLDEVVALCDLLHNAGGNVEEVAFDIGEELGGGKSDCVQIILHQVLTSLSYRCAGHFQSLAGSRAQGFRLYFSPLTHYTHIRYRRSSRERHPNLHLVSDSLFPDSCPTIPHPSQHCPSRSSRLFHATVRCNRAKGPTGLRLEKSADVGRGRCLAVVLGL